MKSSLGQEVFHFGTSRVPVQDYREYTTESKTADEELRLETARLCLAERFVVLGMILWAGDRHEIFNMIGSEPVSYTHLTLPTTPYV